MFSQLVVAKLLAYSIEAATTPTSKLISTPCNFGEIYQFKQTECQIELKNGGAKPIKISHIKTENPADTTDVDTVTVPAQGQAYIKMRVSGSNSLGYTKRYVAFQTDEAHDNQRYGEARGMVLSALEEPKPTLDFEMVDVLSGSLPSKEISLASREVADFRITKILEHPDFLDVSIQADQKTLKATFKPVALWGIHNSEAIKVALDTPRQPEAWIAVKSDIHGEVVPDSNPYALGVMRKGATKKFAIRLRSKSGKDFEVGNVVVSKVKAKAAVGPCKPAAIGCKLIDLDIADDQAAAQIGGLVSVEFPQYKSTLSLYVWGLLLNKETEVLDYNEEMAKRQAASDEAAGKSSVVENTPSKSLDLKSAIKNTVADHEPPPAGTGPLLKWEVANQDLIYGYTIYRSSSEKGPFVRVNDATILAAVPTDHSASAYQMAGQFRDNWHEVLVFDRYSQSRRYEATAFRTAACHGQVIFGCSASTTEMRAMIASSTLSDGPATYRRRAG